MADLDLPGLAKARMALTTMAKQPKLSRAGHHLKNALVRELYVEIREARIAGYSWKKINKALHDAGAKPYMNNNTISKLFHAIDMQYEKETGVKALPVEISNNQRKKKSPELGKAQDSKGDYMSQEIIS